jgi:FKBP-type peptidyl-prolyl cis-trans isomerase SlyD
MEITVGVVVQIHYTLTDEGGDVLDSSVGNEPLAYIQGKGNIIPGLEQALNGKNVGDRFTVTIAPEQAYGARDEALVLTVPRNAFEGVDDIQPGMRFQTRTAQGVHTFTVAEVAADQVVIDGNHPLAGQPLTFDVEVTDVREATADELDHGHVHGEGGHAH